jgi:hypothetical protein
MTRPTIMFGDEGSFVTEVQTCLEITVDGEFGRQTERAVMTFQTAQRITSDGIVGPHTWAKFEEVYELPPYPPPPPPPLDPTLTNAIKQIAGQSEIARYSWDDRGQAPLAYTQGIALAFADAVQRYLAGDSSAIEMAKANTHDADVDVLSWYAGFFRDLGMDNSVDGLDTLRHLFAFMLGLGMRESSGQYCCGRDMSASNVSSDTAEAGLFQMSWNAASSSDEMQKLMDQYSTCPSPQCLSEVFSQGVECSSSEWDCYGSGDGYRYQQMAKQCPIFATHCAAIGLRNLRQHWGPVNRYEVELKREADAMLAVVQELVTPPSV